MLAKPIRTAGWVCALFALSLVAAGPAMSQTLQRIKDTGTIRIGYRLDAVPFSYRDKAGKPVGYTVDICRMVAQGIENRLQLKKPLAVRFVPVTTKDRFDAIRQKRIDMLCGATSVTLSRRRMVDFSVLTFFTGASVMVKKGGPAGFAGLNGKKIAVRKATTTEGALRETLERLGIKATIVAVDSHETGMQAVETGKVDAYFADRAILLWHAHQRGKKGNLLVASNMFGSEPYAIALPLGDAEFRLTVDGLIGVIYRSQAIVDIFKKNFPGAKPSPVIMALYLLNALPD